MSDRKIKFSSRILSGLLAIMMIVFSIPVSMIVFAIGEYDYLEAKNLTAVYDAENDSIIVTWDAIVGDVDSLDVDIDSALGDSVPNVADTTYIFDSTTVSALTGGSHTINLTGSYGTHERTASTTVVLPYNLASVGTVAATNVDNDLTIAEIVAQMPATVELTAETETISANITWNTEGTTYDKSLSTAQSFEVSGTVTLPSTVVNRSAVSLGITGTINSAAATDVAITGDIATSENKDVDESLEMALTTTGTGVAYQWYENGAAISEATDATYTINNVALTDNTHQFYCVATGKNGSTAQSNTLILTVNKVDTTVGLSIDPATGQTRPASITLEATNIPADATGTVEFKAGSNVIDTVTLPAKTTTFQASGADNTYDFSVKYSGNTSKYNESSYSVNGYSFTKGTQTVEFITDTIPSVKTYGDANFTVQAKNTDNKGSGVFEFSIIDEIQVDNIAGDVADINSETGVVTINNAGTFKIQVKAKADNDYNESAAVSTNVITVNPANQSTISFNNGVSEMVYFHNFSYTRLLATEGSGTGAIKYSLGAGTTATGIAIDENTGTITYKNNGTDNDKNVAGTLGTVEVVATKAADKRYKKASTSYTVTVNKADQATLEFVTATPANITYTENNGTTYTNTIGTNNGSVTINNPVVYSLFAATDLNDNAIAVSDLANIDSSTGKITAKRSGVLTVKAYLAGNNVYKDIDKTYTITINRGTIDTEKYKFSDKATTATGTYPEVVGSSIKYGTSYIRTASGGQQDADGNITYSITSIPASFSDEVKIGETDGVLKFVKSPSNATNDSYQVTITATKAETVKYEKCDISYTLTIERDSVDKTSDFCVNGKVIKSEAEWYNKSDEKITVTPSGNYNQISVDGDEWFEKLEYTDDEKATISFYLRKNNTSAADHGATSKRTIEKYNFDKTFATATLTLDNDNFWDKFLETITFGIYRASEQDVVVVAKDELSKVSNVEYFIHDNGELDNEYTETTIKNPDIQWKELSVSEKDENTVEGTVKIEAKDLTIKKAVLYVKVTDNAGNITYLRSNGLVFDIIPPDPNVNIDETDKKLDIEVELSTEGKIEEGLYNNTVPFNVIVKDNPNEYGVTSGVEKVKTIIEGTDGKGVVHKKEVVVSIKTSSKELEEFNSQTTSADIFTFEVKIDDSTIEDVKYEDVFTVPAEFNSNRISIYVEASDWSGNTASTINNRKYLAIDVTKPTIDVTYTASSGNEDVEFSNEKYIGNNQNRKATITITELNFDNSAVEITLKRDGKKLDISPIFKAVEGGLDSNGDQIKWAMDIDYATLVTEDGNIFDFDISYTDKAKNANDAVNYGEYENPQNFIIDNTKPVITVEITNTEVQNEKYFKADRTATVTIKERFFDKNYKFDWSGLTYSLNGTKGTAPTPVATSSDDNSYIRVYKIDFTTEGDYTFDVKYTDLADNLADTYGCNSVAYKEFTVDKTAPTLDITGVADRSANNGTVAPVVTYSDINFDVNTVSVLLTGVNNGTVNYNNMVNNEAQQGSVTYADFERVQNVDDIYTLSAKLTDKAGNETTKSIMFSANRYGSVYNLNSIKELIGKYLQTEQDIVFTETNVDSLEREGIKIKLTKNGTPSDLVEGTDYTVDIAGGNGQWSVYTYTISKKLFANDGRYSVSIYSKDAAGNINENIDETKEAEISFGIDKTKPVIVPIDFESGVQYPVESKTVSIEIKDNLVLDGVKIYLNDKEVKYNVEGETYTFDIPEKNSKQNVRIVAVDAAGNEQELAVTNFLVSTNIFVRWFNNTPLFVGSIAGVVLIAGAAAFFVFRKRRVV